MDFLLHLSPSLACDQHEMSDFVIVVCPAHLLFADVAEDELSTCRAASEQGEDAE